MATKRRPDPAELPANAPLPSVRLKYLRKSAGKTQEDLAAELGVGQDTISRLEKRSDMLLSTLRHYVESVGGQLSLVARFSDRPTVVIDHLGEGRPASRVRKRDLMPAEKGEP